MMLNKWCISSYPKRVGVNVHLSRRWFNSCGMQRTYTMRIPNNYKKQYTFSNRRSTTFYSTPACSYHFSTPLLFPQYSNNNGIFYRQYSMNFPYTELGDTREVLLINYDGKKMGVVPIERVIKMAKHEGLEAHLVAAYAKPPVVRLMSPGEMEEKKEKQLASQIKPKKQQPTIKKKEVTLRPTIAPNDLKTKVATTKRLLSKGNFVSFSILFDRGLDYNKEIADEILQLVTTELVDHAVIEEESLQKQQRRSVRNVLLKPLEIKLSKQP